MALEFQKKATAYNSKLFDQKQVLNAQKQEIQYEAEIKQFQIKGHNKNSARLI